MDLTVLATPFYYATMLAEHRWLKAHRDDPAYDAGPVRAGATPPPT
ncbi:MAG: hypothetical protein V9G12_04695 [Microthrixaceae bacterium]